MSLLFLSYYEFNLYQTYRYQGQAWNVGRVRILAGSDQSLWSYMPLRGEENYVSNFSQSPLTRYLSNLQVTRTGIKVRNESEFGPDRFIHFGVIRPWVLNFFPINLYWRKWCIHLFSVTLNSVSIKLTGNEDRHKISDKFELRPDQSFFSYVPLSGRKK